jgi:di/tricarboxylate transporter
VLRVRCGASDVAELRRRPGVALRPISDLRDEDLEGNAVLAEAVVPSSSPIVGETVKEVRILEAWGAALLAVRHRGSVKHERLDRRPLRAGDLLLLEIPRDRLELARGGSSLLLVSHQEVPGARGLAALAALIVAGVVVLAAQGLLPIASAAIIGCALMIVSGCLTMRQAYEAIDWQVIFLLAGALSLGRAMEQTGTARMVSEGIVGVVGGLGPEALISSFFLLTAGLTAAISNNATAVVLAPIAITTAERLGLDARPFLMAIAFGASASFLTPVGYQTNTLVYGPGKYRFADFARVGGPLVALFWILATVLIPRIWPV